MPYTALRDERDFLYDVGLYPLHAALAEALGLSGLADLHEHHVGDKQDLLRPLLDRCQRRRFHEIYDKFVTSFCIPMLHAQGLAKGVLCTSDVTYRYQAFPCIRVVRPGEFSIGPHCDTAYGHSIGNINFHIPLTPILGANALFVESCPGREDWHPLTAEGPGQGFIFDGARCIHFTLENTTEMTRVSLDFRIALYQAQGRDGLCTKEELTDSFCSSGCSYYDEADVTMDHSSCATVARKSGQELFDPDWRVGLPFSKQH